MGRPEERTAQREAAGGRFGGCSSRRERALLGFWGFFFWVVDGAS